MTPTSSNKPAPAACTGFTLLELLVVLSIIAIATGLIAPNLALTDNSAFRAEVRRAAAALTFARRMAIVEGAPKPATLFTLDPRASDYEDQLEAVETGDNDAHWVSEDLTLSYQDELGQAPEAMSELAVTFFPQGGSTGGRLGFSRDERSALIRVDPITGRITTAYNGEEPDAAE